ncbi:MAG: hypothetical protein J4G13_08125 [Dehalococcoidia bacterium]|nr:hypothetical protein [Dehalococcoidia bacterium]
MATAQGPQDEIAAMQATLTLHSEQLERLNQWLPETGEAMRPLLENIVAELTATRDSVRQELLAIHSRLDVHAAAQARTDENIAGINGEIAGIKETLAFLVARTDTLVEQADATSRTLAENSRTLAENSRALTETNSRLGNITGTRHERRVARGIRTLLRDVIGLYQSQVLHRDWGETDDALIALLDDAVAKDAITRREHMDALDADIIVAGQNAAGQRTYAVVEIGVTVNNTHVNRAARRARTLAEATGGECNAVTVGSEIPDAERERATRAGVVVIAVAAPED